MLYYSAKFFGIFLAFQKNLHLFIPDPEVSKSDPVEPLNMELTDLPLKVCTYYRAGASFIDIEHNMGIETS
jgi:hypothetical protein